MSGTIKKTICFVVCIAVVCAAMAAMVSALYSCGFNKSNDDKTGNDYRMTVVYNDGWCVICRDNETGVQYFSRPNAGSCVMVNTDGTPYTGK